MEPELKAKMNELFDRVAEYSKDLDGRVLKLVDACVGLAMVAALQKRWDISDIYDFLTSAAVAAAYAVGALMYDSDFGRRLLEDDEFVEELGKVIDAATNYITQASQEAAHLAQMGGRKDGGAIL